MFSSFFSFFGSHSASTLHQKGKWSALLASVLTMLLAGLACFWLAPDLLHMMLVASLGPSIIMVFMIPNSPFSQPYVLLTGHVVCAFIGVACSYLPLEIYWTSAIGIGLCMLAMFLLDCVHPPAGATAMMPIIVGHEAVNDFHFIYFPVLSNMLILVLMAVLFHRFWLKKDYPVHNTPMQDLVHKHKDASPLVRLGIQPGDLENALKEFDAYLDITEKDLTQVYGMAQQNAYARKFGEIRCRHIMSHDVITVTADTSVKEAWALLHYHKVKILPVIDQDKNVLGVVSLVDFIKHAKLRDHDGLLGHLKHLLSPNTSVNGKLHYVSDIMTSPVFTVNHGDLIASLVPLLSDKGLHHIPVVGDDGKLAGIVTQSDLIAALYSGAIHQAGQLSAGGE